LLFYHGGQVINDFALSSHIRIQAERQCPFIISPRFSCPAQYGLRAGEIDKQPVIFPQVERPLAERFGLTVAVAVHPGSCDSVADFRRDSLLPRRQRQPEDL
jgi:hypothetical protein